MPNVHVVILRNIIDSVYQGFAHNLPSILSAGIDLMEPQFIVFDLEAENLNASWNGNTYPTQFDRNRLLSVLCRIGIQFSSRCS
jgi:hypothetical protein